MVEFCCTRVPVNAKFWFASIIMQLYPSRYFVFPKVIPSRSLPALEDWMSCDLPLCPVIVDNKTSIECSGEHMLQVC